MNNKDLKIISYLRNNARIPLTKMSNEIKIPVSTIFDRMKLHEEGLILKHTCLLDFSKLGFNTHVNINLKVDRKDKEALKDFLQIQNCVNSLHRINNGFDFMIEGIFKQVKDMEEFLDNLERKFKIQEIESFFIIEDLKREAFMTNIF